MDASNYTQQDGSELVQRLLLVTQLGKVNWQQTGSNEQTALFQNGAVKLIWDDNYPTLHTSSESVATSGGNATPEAEFHPLSPTDHQRNWAALSNAIGRTPEGADLTYATPTQNTGALAPLLRELDALIGLTGDTTTEHDNYTQQDGALIVSKLMLATQAGKVNWEPGGDGMWRAWFKTGAVGFIFSDDPYATTLRTASETLPGYEGGKIPDAEFHPLSPSDYEGNWRGLNDAIASMAPTDNGNTSSYETAFAPLLQELDEMIAGS